MSLKTIPAAPEPWTSEAAVIAAMQPPLNRQHNEAHPFYPVIGAARDALGAIKLLVHCVSDPALRLWWSCGIA